MMKKTLSLWLAAVMCASLLTTGAAAFTFEKLDPEKVFDPDTLAMLEGRDPDTPREDWDPQETEEPQEPEDTQEPAVPAFTDVPASAYYYEAVMWAVEKGITKGTTATTFSPNNTCTNAQILTFMWRAAGSPEPTINNPFTNLGGDEYYAKAAIWALEKGMISGTAFDGGKPCARAMTMEYFWKQAGSPETAVSDKFTDVAADADYAQAVAWAVANGITGGTSGTTFSPNNTCTRGQIVTFLYRAMR